MPNPHSDTNWERRHTEMTTTSTWTPDAVDTLGVNTLRFLAADMVQAANSGHPGMPMGTAPMAWTLFSRHLRHDPTDSHWADRDRFILSAGHGSALLYGLLHVFGYDLPMEELRRFRQLGSATPGHPEYGHTDGVETTTGPLGQGLAMSVGFALAERMQAARYPEITNHHTYVIVGDGCLMEGVSQEAISLAGQFGLGRLIVLWDDNDITIDGAVSQSSSDDQLARYTASGWHVQRVADGTDLLAIDAAISAAKDDARPSMISVRTIIGHGAPGIEGTSKAHGSPLGPEVLAASKAAVGWDYAAFSVPAEVTARAASVAELGATSNTTWQEQFDAFAAADPARAAQWTRAELGELPVNFEEVLATVPLGRPLATRQSSQAALQQLAAALPELVGGSADLAGSTGTATGQAVVTRDDYSGSVIHYGIREFGMAALMNGMSLHGGFRPYGSTFLVFSDYLRPALRLSALMHQPVIYVLTHDSIAVGEDGPTHQPVEHIESLRLIPGVTVLRPADDVETVAAWRQALRNTYGPTVLVLTRQGVPSIDTGSAPDFIDTDGGRVVRDATNPSVDLLATGSEVSLALAAAELVAAEGIEVRVVSVPWRERFAERRTNAAPITVTLEAGVTSGWAGLAAGGPTIGIDSFGASGPADDVLAYFGLTSEAVAERVRAAVHASQAKG